MVRALDSQSRGNVQNHWVAPRSTQPFIIPRTIKGVPELPRDVTVKSKLSHRRGSVALRPLNPIHEKGS